MLPPFLGQLLLLGTAGLVAGCLLLAAWAVAAGRRRVARGALGAMGAGLTVYAVAWLAGPLLATPTNLPPGSRVHFCGLDCHLHVSVTGVRRGPEPVVTVAFESDARAAPEFPSELRVRLREAGGREFEALNAIPAGPLAAGARRAAELRFPGAAALDGAAVVVTWKPGLDLLVPGAGNPLVQAQRRLLLPD